MSHNLLGIHETDAGIQLNYKEISQLFRDRTLPLDRWTHEAHLVVCIWFLMNYDPHDALCRLKSGIINYNISTGGINTGQNGYHETITIFWWKLLLLYVEQNKGITFDEMCTGFLQSTYNRRDIIFDFYSKEIILSGESRATYIAPNKSKIHLD